MGRWKGKENERGWRKCKCLKKKKSAIWWDGIKNKNPPKHWERERERERERTMQRMEKSDKFIGKEWQIYSKRERIKIDK